MFWTANFVGPNELNVNNLLKEENIKLTTLLEADDILQECRNDNKALIEFLTKPEILTELVTLITDEPPKDVELMLQYRHANMACEVLTSQMSALSVRILADTALVDRLCDFVNKEPPLNPLLASYFSKTIEMLLDKSPQQDWCLHRIVCLQALEALRARRGFLPGLLRHLATSAVADVLRVFIRIKENVVVEWLKEHRFLESLIQIICGTYIPEEAPSPVEFPQSPQEPQEPQEPPGAAKVALEAGEEARGEGGEGQDRKKESKEGEEESKEGEELRRKEEEAAAAAAERARRLRGVAAANAAALLCDVIRTGCVKDVSDYYRSWSGTAGWLRGRLAGCTDDLLRAVFSTPPDRRSQALLGAGDILLELLAAQDEVVESVEPALAPHLPLLHQELLAGAGGAGGGTGGAAGGAAGGAGGVGAARLRVATLLARLAASAVHEVPATMLTLGTPGVLLDMFFRYSENNFLHERVLALLTRALHNQPYADWFARHFIEECDLLNRLMDAFEDIEALKGTGRPRPGYSGHVTRLLAALAAAGAGQGPRWDQFVQHKLTPRLAALETPLLGYYPSESQYEAEADLPVANYDLEDPAEQCAELDRDLLSGAYYLEDVSCEDTSADLDEMFAPPAAPPSAPAAPAAPGAPGAPAAPAAPAAVPEAALDDDAQGPWESGSSAAPAEGWARFEDVFGDSFGATDEAGEARRGPGADSEAGGAQGADSGARGGQGVGSEARGEQAARHSEARRALEEEFSPFWSYKDCEGGEGGGDANAADLQEAMESMQLQHGELHSSTGHLQHGELHSSTGHLQHGEVHINAGQLQPGELHSSTGQLQPGELYSSSTGHLQPGELHSSTAELTSHLLTAMSELAPELLANIVNANMTPPEPLGAGSGAAGGEAAER